MRPASTDDWDQAMVYCKGYMQSWMPVLMLYAAYVMARGLMKHNQPLQSYEAHVVQHFTVPTFMISIFEKMKPDGAARKEARKFWKEVDAPGPNEPDIALAAYLQVHQKEVPGCCPVDNFWTMNKRQCRGANLWFWMCVAHPFMATPEQAAANLTLFEVITLIILLRNMYGDLIKSEQLKVADVVDIKPWPMELAGPIAEVAAACRMAEMGITIAMARDASLYFAAYLDDSNQTLLSGNEISDLCADRAELFPRSPDLGFIDDEMHNIQEKSWKFYQRQLVPKPPGMTTGSRAQVGGNANTRGGYPAGLARGDNISRGGQRQGIGGAAVGRGGRRGYSTGRGGSRGTAAAHAGYSSQPNHYTASTVGQGQHGGTSTAVPHPGYMIHPSTATPLATHTHHTASPAMISLPAAFASAPPAYTRAPVLVMNTNTTSTSFPAFTEFAPTLDWFAMANSSLEAASPPFVPMASPRLDNDGLNMPPLPLSFTPSTSSTSSTPETVTSADMLFDGQIYILSSSVRCLRKPQDKVLEIIELISLQHPRFHFDFDTATIQAETNKRTASEEPEGRKAKHVKTNESATDDSE
ncbi:hypothetical protein GGX14DRAFT_387130 [Mycena pura]|uniref:Uncharacterized protein n=1 Tax=Mycena pura TaxID=153505 RepID=A0AAD6YNH6_9AGAR|nr:hypothetical protein GGX14DRAFT_387130 [Mycena pura]